MKIGGKSRESSKIEEFGDNGKVVKTLKTLENEETNQGDPPLGGKCKKGTAHGKKKPKQSLGG